MRNLAPRRCHRARRGSRTAHHSNSAREPWASGTQGARVPDQSLHRALSTKTTRVEARDEVLSRRQKPGSMMGPQLWTARVAASAPSELIKPKDSGAWTEFVQPSQSRAFRRARRATRFEAGPKLPTRSAHSSDGPPSSLESSSDTLHTRRSLIEREVGVQRTEDKGDQIEH